MKKILTVDDQACVRHLLSEELADEGYRVVAEGNSEGLAERIRFYRPDLVLLDPVMDGPDGITVFEDVKAQYPHLPVIIFTAYDTYRDHPVLSRADAYVIKSLFLDELKTRIKDVLGAAIEWVGQLDGSSYWYGESLVQAFDGSRQRSPWGVGTKHIKRNS